MLRSVHSTCATVRNQVLSLAVRNAIQTRTRSNTTYREIASASRRTAPLHSSSSSSSSGSNGSNRSNSSRSSSGTKGGSKHKTVFELEREHERFRHKHDPTFHSPQIAQEIRDERRVRSANRERMLLARIVSSNPDMMAFSELGAAIRENLAVIARAAHPLLVSDPSAPSKLEVETATKKAIMLFATAVRRLRSLHLVPTASESDTSFEHGIPFHGFTADGKRVSLVLDSNIDSLYETANLYPVMEFLDAQALADIITIVHSDTGIFRVPSSASALISAVQLTPLHENDTISKQAAEFATATSAATEAAKKASLAALAAEKYPMADGKPSESRLATAKAAANLASIKKEELARQDKSAIVNAIIPDIIWTAYWNIHALSCDFSVNSSSLPMMDDDYVGLPADNTGVKVLDAPQENSRLTSGQMDELIARNYDASQQLVTIGKNSIAKEIIIPGEPIAKKLINSKRLYTQILSVFNLLELDEDTKRIWSLMQARNVRPTLAVLERLQHVAKLKGWSDIADQCQALLKHR